MNDRFIEIIESNKEEAFFSGSLSDDIILKAEKILELTFPPSYRKCIEKYGNISIFGIEIYGIIKDPEIDAKMIPNMVWITKDMRESGLSKDFIVVADSGYGPVYVIDTTIKDTENESPVFLWDIDGSSEKIADNFGDFFYDLLNEVQ